MFNYMCARQQTALRHAPPAAVQLHSLVSLGSFAMCAMGLHNNTHVTMHSSATTAARELAGLVLLQLLH